ncbi:MULTISPECIES: MATE family efflux transporter [unclassified Peribacillus]|uniref:MATE family efflux transporter n=1 Tax=unclassified Peribacillus TaxID=2675266 RepID=UPI001914167F|nr:MULTISPECIES: MATE family efflux transporter [unclassified Peribacillus]MBK5442103.1 MATE family efflux transporter [Peribacillus sp. TH24]MBK5463121.1 MATE family efflux transporter [Peribacillus sp. TH27]MBK5483537.1 MATE family efflux transporter [Peribacillus sp. TH16]MBK5501328.1 MATE family efflux transporter [Peribacillus sp. TH14]WMX53701.1 MATE family efflux transporter [Peribacillus sp. R9-11]
MNQTYTKSQKIRLLFYILIPILITQIGLYAMTFFDVMMSGQYSTQDVAGVSIGSSLWTPVYTGLSGILIALTPVVSQLVGSKQSKSVSYSVMQAVYLAVTLALVILIIGAFALNPILNAMNLEDTVHRVAHDYLIALSIGIIPLFVYNALRAFIDALGQTRISMIITLCALPINVVFNYLLIYGKFGFPELGGVGSGYATAITYWLIALVAILVVVKISPFSTYKVFREFFRISWKEWRALLIIGVPIGLAIFFETSIFSAVTLLMSKYDTVTIASHQIAMNFASLLYMMPLSISMALTIVIGFEIGAARYKDAKEYSWIGITMALTMSLVLSAILFLFREPVASAYTKDYNVMMLTSHFLIYAIFFQISDALQAPIQGILRGYKDVNVTFAMSLVSYWILGLPIGFIFAKYTGMGAFGYWIGLISGLALGAIGLAARLRYIQQVKYKKMV